MSTATLPEVTLPAIEAWLSSLPGDEVFCLRRRGTGVRCTCPVAGYLRSHGADSAQVGTVSWYRSGRGFFTGQYILLPEAVVQFRRGVDAFDRPLTAAEALTILREVKR